jgi:hypothetical protein
VDEVTGGTLAKVALKDDLVQKIACGVRHSTANMQRQPPNIIRAINSEASNAAAAPLELAQATCQRNSQFYNATTHFEAGRARLGPPEKTQQRQYKDTKKTVTY